MNQLKPVNLGNRIFNNLNLKLCKLLGHQWSYKDYSNYVKLNGEKYEFRASRNCKRCSENAYFYTTWKIEPKSELDYETDYFSLTKIDIDKITYK